MESDVKTVEIDYQSDVCPCCRAGRSASGGDWPWLCSCYKACQVAEMGRTCGGPGKCWEGCPFRAPSEENADRALVRL